jgi:hypothetical protein
VAKNIVLRIGIRNIEEINLDSPSEIEHELAVERYGDVERYTSLTPPPIFPADSCSNV